MIYHVFFVHSSMVVSVSVELILRRNFRYRTGKKERGRGAKFCFVNISSFFFFFFFLAAPQHMEFAGQGSDLSHAAAMAMPDP